MQLELESGIVPGPIDVPAIESALRLLGPEDGSPTFAILSRTSADPDHYVQTHVDENGFVAEKREGHAGAHFTAMRLTTPGAPQREHDRFALAEIIEIFRSYAEGSEPSFWKWAPLEFPE